MQEFNEDITVNNNVTAVGNIAGQTFTIAGEDLIRAAANVLWPVGSIYLSVNAANPSAQFGGTWVAWGTGRVPVGVDTSQTEFNGVEKTGGEKAHALTKEENGPHDHAVITSTGASGNAAVSGELGYEPQYAGLNYGMRTATNGTALDYRDTSTEYTPGQPHNNLQPYITCYMWKRTA